MTQYGLLGEKLSHSFSKAIHEMLGFYSYDLLPMNKQMLHEFMTQRNFKGVNVTIPYKLDVIPYCDEIDESVKRIGSANTIINQNNKLTAYNTDFQGLLYTIKNKNIEIAHKKVMILGSGGTCKTATAVVEYLKAKEILVVSRTKSQQTITYDQVSQHSDVEIIINASPKGMYPNNQEQPIDLCEFSQLEAVIDVIYNPLNTRLLQQAKKLDVLYTNGLMMLIAQAKYAAEIFTNQKISDTKIVEIYKQLKTDLSNVVLVGMPSSGKSTIGKEVSELLNKQFVDIDSLIQQQVNMTIPQIFSNYGEGYFRKLEHDVIQNIAKQTNLVIATGGGAVLDCENIKNLQQNGMIVFINRKIEELLVGGDRPLSKDKDALNAIYEKRYPIYLDCSDAVIQNNGELKEAVNAIKERFYETVSY